MRNTIHVPRKGPSEKYTIRQQISLKQYEQMLKHVCEPITKVVENFGQITQIRITLRSNKTTANNVHLFAEKLLPTKRIKVRPGTGLPLVTILAKLIAVDGKLTYNYAKVCAEINFPVFKKKKQWPIVTCSLKFV